MKMHTPGPWGRVFGSDNLTDAHPADIIGPRGYPIGHVIRVDPAEGGKYTANAQLICAAPDLLAVLKLIMSHAELVPCKDGGRDAAQNEPGSVISGKWRIESALDGWIVEARAAIDKAEGK
jgi:hypothetical protein